MRKVALILIILVLTSFVAGGYFFYQKSLSQKPAYSGQPEKIVIGNVREYSIFNIIAKSKDYFAQNGIDAEIKKYDSGPAGVKDLLAGKVDVALASDNTGVQTIFTHPELRIISQFVRNNVFSIVALKDKGISAPSDLRGKKIGITKKTAGEFLFSEFLVTENLTSKSVVIVDLTPPQIKTELQKGTIDAGVLFEPNVFDLINTLGEKAVVWPISKTLDTFGLIYTTDTFIKTHSTVIDRYLLSLIQAEQYEKNNPEETKALIGKTFGYSKKYIDYSWPKNDNSIRLDQEFLLSMENIARWSIENKLTDKTTVPNYLNFIYFEALEKVKPEAITIIH